jgi:predicted nucleic acid-binding protein
MIALCLDTNAFSSHQKSKPLAIMLIAAVDQIWMPAITLGELRSGFLNGSKSAANELHLQDFLALPYLSVAAVTEVTSQTGWPGYPRKRHLDCGNGNGT